MSPTKSADRLPNTCPNRDALLDYLVGKLPDGSADSLANHLESCANCQAELATLSDHDDTLIGQLRGSPPSDPYLDEPECDAAIARARAVAAGAVAGDCPPLGLPPQEISEISFPRQLGEYCLTERLGVGGMGTVYKALHSKLDRVVALKVLTRARTEDARAVVRFEREMKAIGRLDHPHIVRAYDAREIEGRLVLAMEFVEGLDLARIVRRLGPLGTADACELARQAALGLQVAHEHGLIHRDVKPSNLMLTPEGQVKLLDLGLARFCSETPFAAAATDDEMTNTGQAMGTADYMAPEQASDSRAVDIRADIYSLGATLYKLLSARAPFSGPEHQGTFDKLMAHRQEPIPPIRQFCPKIPDDLVAVLDRMLAKDPAARYATPAEVAESLAPWCLSADLPSVLQRATETGDCPDFRPTGHRPKVGLGLSPSGLQGEGILPSSPLPPGEGKGEGGSSPQPLPAARRWRSYITPILLLLAFGGLCFALGILIRIHKDGQETTIDVPSGSNARVTADGQVDVTLPGEKKATGRGHVMAVSPDVLDAVDAHAFVSVEFPPEPKQTLEEVGRLLGPQGVYTSMARGLSVIDEAGRVRQIRDLLKRKEVRFGPVTQHVVNAVSEGMGGSGLDLTDGKLVDVPKEFARWSAQQQSKWCTENKVDLAVDYLPEPSAGGNVYLVLEDMKLAALRDGHWDRIICEELKSVLASVTPGDFDIGRGSKVKIAEVRERRGHMYFNINTPLPATFAFQTRRGDLGLLQVLRYTEQPRGMRIRYKLAQQPAPSAIHLETTLLYFYADWSAPSRAMAPTVDELTREGFAVQRVNIDRDRALANRFRVNAVPCFVVLQQGKEVDRVDGGTTLQRLKAALQRPSAAASPAVNPAAELKALQGSWKVVRIEKGKDADALWRTILRYGEGDASAATLDRIDFKNGRLQFLSFQTVCGDQFCYSIDPTLPTKTIDLYSDPALGNQLVALAIYETAGDQLKIFLRRNQRALKMDQRPKSFVTEPNSGDILLVLERYQLSDDEKQIEGNWVVSSQTESGNPVSEEGLLAQTCRFEDAHFDLSGRRTDETRRSVGIWSISSGLYTLDASKQPKTITIYERKLQHEQGKWNFGKQELLGIYKLDGDRLTIAYHKGEPRPEKFESTSGSGVTLLVLEKASARAAAASQPVTGSPAVDRGGRGGRGGAVASTLPATAPQGSIMDLGGSTQPPSSPPTVTVARPVVREITDYEDFTGRTEAAQTVEIRARVTGTLEKILFKAGATVKQGDMLLEIDPRSFQAGVAKHKADVRLAQLRQKRLTADLEGAKLMSSKERQRIESEQAEVEAALKAAEGGLELAELQLASTRLTAPIGGLISRPLLSAGNLVQADSMSLATICSVDPMCVSFDVDERTVLNLRRNNFVKAGGEPALSVLFALADEQDFPHHGKLDSTDARMDQATGTAHWRALFPNADGLLMPGMYVRVRMATSAPHKALLMPEQPFHMDQGRLFVYVVTKKEGGPVVEYREVKIGRMNVVQEGLTTDDWVVVSDVRGLRPGMRVKPEEVPVSPAPPKAKPK